MYIYNLLSLSKVITLVVIFTTLFIIITVTPIKEQLLNSPAGLWGEEVFWTNPQGQRIIKALDRYKRDMGVYPLELQNLVPRYIEKLPPARLIGDDALSTDHHFKYELGYEEEVYKGSYSKSKYILSYLIGPTPYHYGAKRVYIPSQAKWVNK
jgi:hypothetical protein